MNLRYLHLSHEDVARSMPAFVQGTLSSDEQERIRAHLAACDDCAALHREDMQLAELLSSTPPALEPLLCVERIDANRKRLLRRIAHTDGRHRRIEFPAKVSWPQRSIAAWSGALAAGLCVIAIGAVLTLQKPGQDSVLEPVVYKTRSATAENAAADPARSYRVVFRPGMEAGEIERLFRSFNGAVVESSSHGRVYTVVFAAGSGSDAELLSRLRRRPEILLAEKSIDLQR